MFDSGSPGVLCLCSGEREESESEAVPGGAQLAVHGNSLVGSFSAFYKGVSLNLRLSVRTSFQRC